MTKRRRGPRNDGMDKKTNILQVVLSLGCGGAERLAVDLCAKLNANGFNASLCCLDGLGELEDEAKKRGVKVFLVQRKQGKDLTLPFKLAGLMRKNNIQVVHTHNLTPLLYGTLAARIARVSAVVNTRHGREKKHGGRFIWGMNNAVAAISQDAKRELLKCNHIKPEKVRVIYNGIDMETFKIASSLPLALLGVAPRNDEGEGARNDCYCDLRKELNIAADARVIGTVARLSAEKDQHTLLSAFTKVNALIKDSILVIAGDGALRDDLESHARYLGVHEKVRFLGFCRDIPRLLSIFDVFVLSSLTEGISLTLLEAMAAGKPVVATNVGGNPEVVAEGETGLLVSPKDPEKLAEAIIRLLQNPELARKMGEAGHRRVEEKFSLDRMVREYEELYRECLGYKSL